MHIYAIIATLGVSLVSLIGVTVLSVGEEKLKRNMFILVSLAVGALLGDAFLHIIPESLEAGLPLTPFLFIAGIIIFFVIEKLLHWHHHGEDAKENHIHPVGPLVLVSDGFHNFLDGIIIGVGFLAGTEIGIATTIAVILHEIPQEIGDFAVLLHAGYTKRKAILLNFISSLFAIAGVFVSILLSEKAEGFTEFALPLAAGGFIYIALSDLVPELHKDRRGKALFLQIAMIVVGVAAMAALLVLE